MRETVTYVIDEESAGLLFAPDEGKRLAVPLREIELAPGDPRAKRIEELHRQMRAQGDQFYEASWVNRQYTSYDLEAAELFHWQINAEVEPCGEECGTVYDESQACPHCGNGRRQVSALFLDLRKAPRRKDVAQTIACDEWIVSQRLADMLTQAGMTGFELRPVQHKAQYQDDAIADIRKYPSGQEYLRRTHGSLEWRSRSRAEEAELVALLEQMAQEYAAEMEARASRGEVKPLPKWYQLVVTSHPVPVVPPTRFGASPLNEELEGRATCPLGHNVSHRQSEMWVAREAWDGSDLIRTQQTQGRRLYGGAVAPEPLLLISPRLWRLLRAEKVKEYQVEVAHWI